MPRGRNKYYRIDNIERFLDVEKANSWSEIEESNEYKSLKKLTQKMLDGYNEDRVRQKYIWIDNGLFQIERKIKAEKDGELILI